MQNIFRDNILSGYSSKGQNWLDHLTDLTQKLAQRWHLEDLHPVDHLSYNYILKGTQNQKPIVLKLGIDLSLISRESKALKIIKKYGGVQILNYDLKNGAILMEQLHPGNTLKTFFLHREAESIEIVCRLIEKLHQAPYPLKSSFSSLEEWFAPLEKQWLELESYLIKGRFLKELLLKSQLTNVFLHGDIHHDNILCHNNTWHLIDPKGIIGNPLYDICNFIINPLEDMQKLSHTEQIIQNRVNIFAQKLNIDSHIIFAWCFIYTLLSSCWSIEENQKIIYQQRLLKFFDCKC